jgi:hypothetical protein
MVVRPYRAHCGWDSVEVQQSRDLRDRDTAHDFPVDAAQQRRKLFVDLKDSADESRQL